MMRHPHVWMRFLLRSTVSPAHGARTSNMAPGASVVSDAVYDLHMTIFWICVVIGIVVFAAMLWSMIVHRRATGQTAAHFHEERKQEAARLKELTSNDWTREELIPADLYHGAAIDTFKYSVWHPSPFFIALFTDHSRLPNP